MSEQTGGLFENVFPEPPQHATLPKRTFKPWHKTRKQFIRELQWNADVKKLCTKHLKFKDDRPLHYLSLPGDDLLDVRMLHQCLSAIGRKLKYLGLHESYGAAQPRTWLNVSTNQVNSLPGIWRGSTVIHDLFQQIANKNSQAYRHLQDYGDFDVVNLDLCESVSPPGKQKATPPPSYYDALNVLTEYQINSRTEAWLLFVTSRVGKTLVEADDMEKLSGCVGANTKEHPDFATRLIELIPSAAGQNITDRAFLRDLSDADFFSLFGIGLGKWLLRIMRELDPWVIQMQRGYCYSVEPGTPDMLSLSFLFRPYATVLTDTSGLSKVQTKAEPVPGEKELGLDVLKAVKTIENVDSRLESDEKLRSRLETSTISLLKSAGYPHEEIDAWLKKH
ncbi:MAG TPA: hypothetical protein VNZ64_02310 [Candidatus Acidoferrum sp.]|jgi:hypothetical protein|nr:hypothetical protein [Candidatus Acidoferrum sp.]